MAKTCRRFAGRQGSDPIDRGYFARFTRGNAKLEREVLELFCAQMPISLQRLRGARSGGAWRDAAHTIKGSASAIGAWRLAGMAELARSIDIENAAGRSQGWRDAAERALSEAAEDVCRHIERLYAKS